jgi:HSP20 family protein
MSRRDDPFQDVEKLFDQLTQFGTAAGGDLAVDVVDQREAFVVTAELPGYTAADIDVELPDSTHLQITAAFDRSESKDEADFVVSERRRQSTSRTIALPEPVDEHDTDATYNNGILTVRLGKQASSSEGTDIPVN